MRSVPPHAHSLGRMLGQAGSRDVRNFPRSTRSTHECRHSYLFGGPGGFNRDSFPSPTRFKISDTVETGIDNAAAISGPVNRIRRRAAIASTRCSGVAVG